MAKGDQPTVRPECTGIHVIPLSVVLNNPPPSVAAYSVFGLWVSTWTSITVVAVMPELLGVQFVPASTLLKIPWPVPTYSVDGFPGLMIRKLTTLPTGSPELESVQTD